MSSQLQPDADEGTPAGPDAVLAAVRAFVAELHPHQAIARVTLDSTLERDLGIDSLARMELLHRLETQFGMRLSEQVMANAETTRDLLRAILSGDRRHEPSPRLEVTAHAGLAQDEKPDGALTLIDVLDWHVQAHPDRVHVHFLDEEERSEPLTYGALRAGAEEIALGLSSAGIAPGQAVAIMLPSGIDYFHCFMGVLLAGAVPVPIYPPVRLSQMEDHVRRHARILENARVRILITFAQVKPIARLLKAQVESLDRVATVAELKGSGSWQSPVVLKGDDIAFLQYTSGSTGNPKGVILTHQNILANIRAMDAALETSSADVFVSWLPLYHDMGLIGGWLGSLYVGYTLVLMSPLTFLSRPARWLRAIHTHRGTISGGPNFAFELCVRRIDDKEIEGLDLSSWRYVFNGAEPVSADTLRRFVHRFSAYGLSDEAIAPVYGLAEATLGLGFPPIGRGLTTDRIKREALALEGRAVPAEPEDTEAVEVVACGQPLRDYQVRVVDESGHELPERRQGRLEFKGPSTTSGYYRNPEATQALFQGDWLDSGDLAYIAGGDIYITSREKDIIIRAGRNIYPFELEEAVGDVPGVRKGCVAVFGASDPRTQTERVVVVAETRETEPGAHQTLRERINELAVDLTGVPPDDIVLAPPRTVLKTSSGKIRRSATRELYERGALSAGTRSVWLQFLRLGWASLTPRVRRARQRTADALFAAWAWSAAAVVGLTCWLVVVLAPLERWRWRSMQWAGKTVLWLTGTRVSVSGIEHVPAEGAFVLVSNHQSYLDGPLLVAVMPRPISYVVKGELARNWFFGRFLTRAGVEFVERFDVQRGVEDSRRIAQQLGSNRPVGYFPEGTIRRMPGLLPFHMGAFVNAAEAGVPLVAVTIRGTRSILRDESWRPRRGEIQVVVSPPFLPDSQALSTWDAAIALRDAARAHMLEHCAEPDLVAHSVRPG